MAALAKWTDINDVLPAVGQLVLVAVDTGPGAHEWDVAAAHRWADGTWRRHHDASRPMLRVTHWQPWEAPPNYLSEHYA